MPRESTVVAVLREGHVVVPRGDTVLHEGDEVLVLVTGGVEDDVRHALVG
ncbi:MAG: TrkA C-terminal domain-containing protein [Ilumatobacteraceae bacterium]